MKIKRKVSCIYVLKAFEAIIHFYHRIWGIFRIPCKGSFFRVGYLCWHKVKLKKKKGQVVTPISGKKSEVTGVKNS